MIKKCAEIFLENIFFSPHVFQSIKAKSFVTLKKDSVQSLHSEKNEKFKKFVKSRLKNIKCSLLNAAISTFHGHLLEDFAENFDRNLNLVLGVVYPTCTHPGHFIDIVNSVFGASDT